MLAKRMAEKGREVYVLERGLHVDPSEFTEDESKQFASLYADGGMQMSTDARFQVLQGKCVGGTTVVNNAVCFDLPDHVLERWNDGNGLDAGLDEADLAAAFERLREFMPIKRMTSRKHLAGGAVKFREGIEELGLDRTGDFDVVEANMSDCLGSGYCNIGCPLGRKLSALDYTLPMAQSEHPDGLKILSECGVERITPRNGSAAEVECKLSDGRKLRVSANTVIVSAGALASSLILQRSSLGGPNAGRGLSFNLGAPMTADFPDKIDSFRGLQISHYLRTPGDDGLILETWFNPVGAQSLFMPGWFRDHYRNMRRYDHMACTGSVVGTRPDGRVSLDWRGKMKLKYDPHPDDLKRLVAGLKLAGRIYLAAGATRVMPTTFRFLPFTDPGVPRRARRPGRGQHGHPAPLLAPAGRQRDQPQPHARRRRPRLQRAERPRRLRLRRQRVPGRHHRQPAADGDGAGRVRGRADRVDPPDAPVASRRRSSATCPACSGCRSAGATRVPSRSRGRT